MDGYEIAFVMLVMTVAAGSAWGVAALLDKWIVSPILKHFHRGYWNDQ